MDMDALNESCAVASARRQFLVGLGTSVTTTLLAGCTSDNGSNANGPKTTPDEIPKGGTLEVTAADDPQNLDPHTTTIDVAQMVLDNVVEGLFTLDENLKLEPVLATDYKLHDNETKYDIALKENVTFHDGSEFTSADVKYSIERILDPDVGSPRAANFETVDSIETPDDYTVQFVLSEPFAPFLIGLAESASIIPEGSAEANNPKRNPVGTGPFRLDSWEADETVSLVAFDKYHESNLPHLDSVTFTIVPETATRLTQLQSGSAHVMFSVPFQKANSLNGGGTTLQSVNGLWKQSFWFNTNVEPFTNPAVRRALSYAINRQKLVQGVLFGHGEIVHSPVPPNSPWAKQITTGDAHGFDKGKAKSMLNEAGVDPKSITAMIKASRTPGPTYKDTATLVQSMLSQLGMNIQVEIMDFSTWLQEVWVDKKFELSIGSWSGRIDPDGWYFRQYHTDGDWNRWNYSNPDVDNLLEEARTTTTETDRAKLYSEVDSIVSREVPITYLYARQEMTGLKNRVGNYELTATHQAEFDRAYIQQ